MSKSLGNALYPIEICESWARICFAFGSAPWSTKPNVKMSERVMTQLSEAYRKDSQHISLCPGNLGDFDPARDALSNDSWRKSIVGCWTAPASWLESAASGNAKL